MGSGYEEIKKRKAIDVTEASANIIANWNADNGTSGDVGPDVVTITIPSTGRTVNKLAIRIAGLTVGAVVEIRTYTNVSDSAMDEEYKESFIVGTDPDTINVIEGPTKFTANLRVELYSDQAADDGATVKYHIK